MTGAKAFIGWQKYCLTLLLIGASTAQAACSVSSSGMGFGPYQPLTFPGKLTSSDVLSTGIITIACTGIITAGGYTLSLGPTNTAGHVGAYAPRYMTSPSGGPEMQFNIYTDAARTMIWGDGIMGNLISSVGLSILIGNSSNTVTVYGKVPGGQNTLKAGTYSGSMTVTLIYGL